MGSIAQLIASIGQKAKKASNSYVLPALMQKNNALVNIASEIQRRTNLSLMPITKI